MTTDYLYILLSVLLGILFIRFLRHYDIHEQEPWWAMVVVAVWGGFWAAVFAVGGYKTLMALGIQDPSAKLGPLLIVGPVEETAKLLALATSYPLIRKELDEPTDGLIYMSCVALGFSLIENYFYTVSHPSGGTIFAMRIVICTPMHILFSACVGLAFYQVVKGQARWTVLLVALLYGIVAHGIYDMVVLAGWAVWLLIPLAWFCYWWTMKLLSYTTATSPHRLSLAGFVADQDGADLGTGWKCPRCGSEGEKETYRQGKIVFQKCDGCSAYVTRRLPLLQMFRHYGAAFRRLRWRDLMVALQSAAKNNDTAITAVDYRTPTGKEPIYFHLDPLNDVLEDMNRTVIARHEGNPFFRWFVGA